MGAGAFIEPLVVVALLFGGTFVNRNKEYRLSFSNRLPASPSSSGSSSPILGDALLNDFDERYDSYSTSLPPQVPRYRRRTVQFLGWSTEVATPDTRVFQGRLLSRLLRKFPFLVEAWYWAGIYWIYQIGRSITALTLVEGTVHTARRHALQLIRLEEGLHIFYELQIQEVFLARPALMHWINRIYSFIHIPGTILFLVWLYYYTDTTQSSDLVAPLPPRRRKAGSQSGICAPVSAEDTSNFDSRGGASSTLYEARRRTMAMCNLIAFVVFTIWPCMPPRLLNDKGATGPLVDEARKFKFVDTVHGATGESSVWTQNKFCNQYAAMPSLHFGYSLLIGLTIMTVPVTEKRQRRRCPRPPFFRRYIIVPSWRRLACILVGFLYPCIILVAIIATANHFILDAVAGAAVCTVAWKGNRFLLNLVALEDWFLYYVRIHKPERVTAWGEEAEERDEEK